MDIRSRNDYNKVMNTTFATPLSAAQFRSLLDDLRAMGTFGAGVIRRMLDAGDLDAHDSDNLMAALAR